jgi:type IV secretion system protein VirB11
MSNVSPSAFEMQDVAKERLHESLRRDLGGVVLGALNDPKVIEVMLNPDGRVWIEDFTKGMVDSGYQMPASQALKLFATIASMLNTVVNASSPILEGELPLDGSRFEGLEAPVVGRPIFAIRKKAEIVFTLEKYRDDNILTDKTDPLNRRARRAEDFSAKVKGLSHYEILKLAIMERKNILVVGGTGSGKTTFVNAIIDSIARMTPAHRIVLIEDTGEIQCNAKNYVQLRACRHVDMQQLLKATMRLRPDRILVGEVRGGEALALLKAWNTGHPGGVATVHANDAEAGLVRVDQLIQEAGVPSNPQLIAEAVDMVVFIDKEVEVKAGRKIKEVMLVEQYDPEQKRYVVTRV